MVVMGVGVMGSTDWSGLRQGAIGHGFCPALSRGIVLSGFRGMWAVGLFHSRAQG